MENKERHIIDSIKEYRESVDMDHLWKNVAPHIPKEKKKRRFGFLFFVGFLLIGLLSLGFLYIPKAGSDQISKNLKAEVLQLEGITSNIPSPNKVKPELSEEEIKINEPSSIVPQENLSGSTKDLKPQSDYSNSMQYGNSLG